MRKQDFRSLLETTIHSEELKVCRAGQEEYAHSSPDAFDNFNRLAAQLGISREEVLLVFAAKHLDGIVSYVRGHTSQREDVRRRIKDLRMYLALLWGMVEEGEREERPGNGGSEDLPEEGPSRKLIDGTLDLASLTEPAAHAAHAAPVDNPPEDP